MATGLTETDPYHLHYFNEGGVIQTNQPNDVGKLYHAVLSGCSLDNLIECDPTEESTRIAIDGWDEYGWQGGEKVPKLTFRP